MMPSRPPVCGLLMSCSTVCSKLLLPPERGWHRAAGQRAAAAALAGLDDLEDDALHAVVHHEARLSPVLDAVVATALTRGHARGNPLLLHQGVRDHLLLEAEGLFVIAAAPSLGPVIAAAARNG